MTATARVDGTVSAATKSDERAAPLGVSRAALWLVGLIVVLTLPAAGIGLFWTDDGQPYEFTTLRDETAEIYGRGLYRHDTVFAAAGYRAVDATLLFAGLPALVVCALLYRRGSLRAGLLLSGVLAYFLYAYLSYAVGAAFNGLFLAYVALFSASFFALTLVFTSIDLRALPAATLESLPRRGPGLFMLAAGGITSVVWLAPLLAAMLDGRPPDLLDSYTTMVTDALDLGLITPAALLAGVLMLRRDPLGYRIAFPLLGIILLLVPQIVLGTLFQRDAGVGFTAGEAIGPISGFVVLGLLAAWVTVAILRRLPGAAGPARRAID